MKTRRYLFSFSFEKNTQNSYIEAFLKENEIDFFFYLGVIYADLFGHDVYYRLETEHVCENVFEVYYEPEKTQKRELSRKYPLIEKAIKVHTPTHEVEVSFENGDSIITKINGTKDEVEKYYLNNIFNLGTEFDNMQRAIKVEFVA